MDSISNIQTFEKNVPPRAVVDNRLTSLLGFAAVPKAIRTILSLSVLSYPITGIQPRRKHYVFSYQHKKYPFEVLSNWDLQKFDIEILKDVEKRLDYALLRTLKLASSKHTNLIDPHVVIGNSSLDVLYPIITFFKDKDSEKVIDYARNLVMNKEDYYQLFEFQEISRIDSYELYCIYQILEESKENSLVYPLLLFPKECLRELSPYSKRIDFTQKFDANGINCRNYTLFGHHCDNMFFDSEDYDSGKYDALKVNINAFTMKKVPSQNSISFIDEMPIYQIQKTKFGCLSDFFIPEAEEVETLHSNERYEHCHENSHHIGAVMSSIYTDVYIIGGKISCNDKEYAYHSWIEVLIDGEWYVLDFNHNLWMKRKEYYKIYEAIAISKTKASGMKEMIQTVIFDAGLYALHPMDLNFFGNEFQECLQKNEKIMSKKAQ